MNGNQSSFTWIGINMVDTDVIGLRLLYRWIYGQAILAKKEAVSQM